jgi:pantetheine-phosphate adenylyltransferase
MTGRSGKRRVALFPASFDPITNGHLDLIQRSRAIFDEVVLALARNVSKTAAFSTEERLAILTEVTKDMEDVTVQVFDGLVVHYAQQIGATAIIRGLRAIADFEYEFEMALMNKHLAPDVEIVFFMTSQEYLYVSSSRLKELVRFGASIDEFVRASSPTRSSGSSATSDDGPSSAAWRGGRGSRGHPIRDERLAGRARRRDHLSPPAHPDARGRRLASGGRAGSPRPGRLGRALRESGDGGDRGGGPAGRRALALAHLRLHADARRDACPGPRSLRRGPRADGEPQSRGRPRAQALRRLGRDPLRPLRPEDRGDRGAPTAGRGARPGEPGGPHALAGRALPRGAGRAARSGCASDRRCDALSRRDARRGRGLSRPADGAPRRRRRGAAREAGSDLRRLGPPIRCRPASAS